MLRASQTFADLTCRETRAHVERAGAALHRGNGGISPSKGWISAMFAILKDRFQDRREKGGGVFGRNGTPLRWWKYDLQARGTESSSQDVTPR